MRIRDTLLLIGIAFIWGFNFVVIRWGLDHFPPLLFSALRFAVCSLPILFGLQRPDIGWKNIIALGVTLGLLVFGLLYLGIYAGMGAGLASAVMQAQVFFTLAIGYAVLGERLTGSSLVAIGLGFSGLALIFVRGGQHAPTIGFLLVLGGALSWGVSNVLIKKLPKVKMLNLMVWISIVPPLPLLILSFLFEGESAILHAVESIEPRGFLTILYTSVLSTLLAYGVWGAMLQRYTAALVSPFALLIPVFGLACSTFFLGERPAPLDLLGPALIIVALIINWRGAKLDHTAALKPLNSLPARTRSP